LKVFKRTIHIFIFALLTLFTQVGGIVYLFSLLLNKWIAKKVNHFILNKLLRHSSFLILYLLTIFFIVPIIAKSFGRVQLPITKQNNLQPLNILTFLCNRNYVEPALRETTMHVAQEMNAQFPGTVINYLDAGFPFINGYPLLPHLSHNDGKKIDLAFCYIDKLTKSQINNAPSFIGYGICEEPRPGETNTADLCASSNHWQYSLLKTFMPQENHQNFIFDSARTKMLLQVLSTQSEVGKIFIEPHLKTRLLLTSDKIRFQGCQAVRHDDHIHVQLK
jgi:hypothetical protein